MYEECVNVQTQALVACSRRGCGREAAGDVPRWSPAGLLARARRKVAPLGEEALWQVQLAQAHV
eukprot:4719283-Prymnesium_polylepis.1